jgi:hypothetical protein
MEDLHPGRRGFVKYKWKLKTGGNKMKFGI